MKLFQRSFYVSLLIYFLHSRFTFFYFCISRNVFEFQMHFHHVEEKVMQRLLFNIFYERKDYRATNKRKDSTLKCFAKNFLDFKILRLSRYFLAVKLFFIELLISYSDEHCVQKNWLKLFERFQIYIVVFCRAFLYNF